MTRPNIQINDVVREMTEEEYAALLESGWTPGEQTAPTLVEEEEPTNAPDTPSDSDPSPSEPPLGL